MGGFAALRATDKTLATRFHGGTGGQESLKSDKDEEDGAGFSKNFRGNTPEESAATKNALRSTRPH